MAQLIADSGSTNTAWRLASASESKTIMTEGLNPYYHSQDTIKQVLAEKLVPKLEDCSISKIFFYGAGCDRPERNEVVRRALAAKFPKTAIEVQHDLLGAARACFFAKPGIACILGTGSNSCLYDGQKITEHIPSLAFVLGDEGSAGYFGKKLINAYFRREFPDDLKEELEASYNMSLSHIMDEVYSGRHPSRFVASYGRFLSDHKRHPFIREILREGFENFICGTAKSYSHAKTYPLSFVGSVAKAHQHLIGEILANENLQCGDFIANPMERLVAYHIS